MALHTQVYQVPVVFQDLHSSEGLLQMFDALEYLDSVVNDVFTKIKNRVADERAKINSLEARARTAQAKIDAIRGTNKATTVLSPHKYPGLPEDKLDYIPLYHDVPLHEPDYNEYDFPEQMPKSGEEGIQDVLFIRNSTLAQQRSKPMDKKEGLGRLPEHLPSVSSLILFNSSENPYKNYSTLDNLLGVDKAARKVVKKSLGAQPRTLAEGDVLPNVQGLDINYKPRLGAIPTFDLPTTMPGLPGVAELSFDVGGLNLPSIAPSAEANLALPATDGWVETKNLYTPSTASRGNNTVSTNNNMNNSGQPPPPPSAAAPAAPPPPPPISSGGPPPPPPPPMSSAPAPPPPPPSMGGGGGDDSDDGFDNPAPSGGGGGGDEGRNSLMEAIRKASMKNLKKVDLSEEEAKPKPAPKSGGGNILGDLMETLRIRRIAFSGGEGDKKKKGGPVKNNAVTADAEEGEGDW